MNHSACHGGSAKAVNCRHYLERMHRSVAGLSRSRLIDAQHTILYGHEKSGIVVSPVWDRGLSFAVNDERLARCMTDTSCRMFEFFETGAEHYGYSLETLAEGC
jgi:hypothetical protein